MRDCPHRRRAARVVGKVRSPNRQAGAEFAEQTVSVTIGATERAAELPALSKVLDGIEAMAADASGPVAVIIDEFQQLIADHGATAEKQLRATVQKHRRVAYVFALRSALDGYAESLAGLARLTRA